jgi:cyclopropane fatty-acyl-phospholipid synthase-like methyltransferase
MHLKELYEIKGGFINKTKFPDGCKPTYGEITEESVDKLFELFKERINENSVFYDIGSGAGKMVIHAGLEYPFKKSCGIELSKERYELSLNLKEQFAPNDANISFINGSFLEEDFSDANIVYFDNMSMSNKIDEFIFNKLPHGCLFIFRKSSLYKCEINPTYLRGYETTYRYGNLTYLIKE